VRNIAGYTCSRALASWNGSAAPAQS
jgi:hypothetical protein